MRLCAQRWACVLAAALLLCWPAFWNGFPLMFPDSVSYLSAWELLPALSGKAPYLFWHRSTFYELSILPFHGDRRWIWPVIGLHGVLTAWLLQLTLRTSARRYLLCMLGLALLTPASWMVSYLMPDIISGLLILSLFWLGPGWQRLSQGERIGVAALALWTVPCHTVNYAVGMLLAAWSGLRRRWPAALRIGLTVLLGLSLQLALNYRIYRRWDVQVEKPPFILARMLEDGPMVRYLDERGNGYALAGNLDDFPMQASHILWDPNGLVNRTRADKPQIWERLRREELSLALATWLAYPWEQARVSLGLTAQMLRNCSASDMLFVSQNENFRGFQQIAPDLFPAFAASRQGRGELRDPRWLTLFFQASYGLSLVAVAWGWRRAQRPWKELAGWTLLGIVLNATLAACLSMPAGRYHLRTVWLLGALVSLRWLAPLRRPDPEPGTDWRSSSPPECSDGSRPA